MNIETGFRRCYHPGQPADFTSYLTKAKELGNAAWNTAASAVGGGGGVETVRATVGGIPFLGSAVTSDAYDSERTDEKHYFLVPDRRQDHGHSLHVVRCLPVGVPPINDLPKRRVFHLPADGALPTVEHLLLADARSAAELGGGEGSLSTRLNELADGIDGLDQRFFNGALLLGGLVALVNPVAGVVLAGKSLLPSVGLVASKYGLRYAGDAADGAALSSRVRAAEKDVRAQFRGADAVSLVNPVLAQLATAVVTTEDEYDPLMAFDSDAMTFGELDRVRLLRLTCGAVAAVYDGVLDDRRVCEAASLGTEDVRFLRMLAGITGG